jgi:hypothetical protein
VPIEEEEEEEDCENNMQRINVPQNLQFQSAVPRTFGSS